MFVVVCGVMCALQLIPKPGRKSISLRGTGASNALLLLIDRSTVSTDRSGTTFQARARDYIPESDHKHSASQERAHPPEASQQVRRRKTV